MIVCSFSVDRNGKLIFKKHTKSLSHLYKRQKKEKLYGSVFIRFHKSQNKTNVRSS